MTSQPATTPTQAQFAAVFKATFEAMYGTPETAAPPAVAKPARKKAAKKSDAPTKTQLRAISQASLHKIHPDGYLAWSTINYETGCFAFVGFKKRKDGTQYSTYAPLPAQTKEIALSVTKALVKDGYQFFTITHDPLVRAAFKASHETAKFFKDSDGAAYWGVRGNATPAAVKKAIKAQIAAWIAG